MNKKIVSKPGRTQGLFQRAELHDFSKSRKIAASNLPHSVKWGVIVSMDKYSYHAVFPFFFLRFGWKVFAGITDGKINIMVTTCI